MKKVINGRMYNTDTAKLVASYANGGGWGDFHHFEEGLYQKKTGEFFLHGEGGAKTAYSRQIDCNCWTKKWAEKYCTGDEYEAIFGEVEE